MKNLSSLLTLFLIISLISCSEQENTSPDVPSRVNPLIGTWRGEFPSNNDYWYELTFYKSLDGNRKDANINVNFTYDFTATTISYSEEAWPVGALTDNYSIIDEGKTLIIFTGKDTLRLK